MKCVSIMLVTYNRLSLTKRMLENLIKTTDVAYRLIIVDNGSTDGTVEFLTNEFGEILKSQSKHCINYQWHLNEKNMGIAIGRNLGLQIADEYKDDWYCTLDNDVELPDNWLKECIEIMEVNPNFSIGVNMEDVTYPLTEINGKTFQIKDAGNLGTAATVFNIKLHQAIGFFTTEYNSLYGTEDANFFFRARLAGWQLGYLATNGIHFGVGDLDIGEYRKFKDECHKKNFTPFQKDCFDYMAKRKSIYIPFP